MSLRNGAEMPLQKQNNRSASRRSHKGHNLQGSTEFRLLQLFGNVVVTFGVVFSTFLCPVYRGLFCFMAVEPKSGHHGSLQQLSKVPLLFFFVFFPIFEVKRLKSDRFAISHPTEHRFSFLRCRRHGSCHQQPLQALLPPFLPPCLPPPPPLPAQHSVTLQAGVSPLLPFPSS